MKGDYMEITVPVRLTEEDVAASASDICDANELAKKKSLIIRRSIIIVFTIIDIFGFILWVIISVLLGRGIFIKTAIPMALLFIFNFTFFIYFAQLPKITKNSTIKNNLGIFRKDYSRQMLHTYVLSAAGITDESKTENSMLHWEEIYHLAECSSCFIIEVSSSKKFIMPRRCFENAQQLRDFRSIVSSNMPASKWSFNGIPLGLSKPDAKTAESCDDTVPLPDQKDCLYSITYHIEEKESVVLSLSMFRFSNSFRILVAFFAFLFGMEIWLSLHNPIILTIIILIDLYFIFRMFRIFRKAALKSARTDSTRGQDETASFFADRVVIKTRNGHAEYFWNTIERIKILRTGLLIYLHPGLSLIFPARVINSMPNKDEFKAFLKTRKIAGKISK